MYRGKREELEYIILSSHLCSGEHALENNQKLSGEAIIHAIKDQVGIVC